MIEYVRPLLAGQYGAAMQMLGECITACPADQWTAVMARHPFGTVAYHTLFFTELYLAPAGLPFMVREVHTRADPKQDGWGDQLSQAETVELADDVRRRITSALAADTDLV